MAWAERERSSHGVPVAPEHSCSGHSAFATMTRIGIVPRRKVARSYFDDRVAERSDRLFGGRIESRTLRTSSVDCYLGFRTSAVG